MIDFPVTYRGFDYLVSFDYIPSERAYFYSEVGIGSPGCGSEVDLISVKLDGSLDCMLWELPVRTRREIETRTLELYEEHLAL